MCVIQPAPHVPGVIVGGRPVFRVEIQGPERAAAHEVVIEAGIEIERWDNRPGELSPKKCLAGVEIVAEVCAKAWAWGRGAHAPVAALRFGAGGDHGQ